MNKISVLFVSFVLLGTMSAQAPAPVPLTTVETAFLVAANSRLETIQSAATKTQAALTQVTTQEQAAMKVLTDTPTSKAAQQVAQLLQQMEQLTRQNGTLQSGLATAQKELATDETKVLGLHSLPEGSTFAPDFTTATPAQ